MVESAENGNATPSGCDDTVMNIIVIGAGLAGLSLSLGLAKAGFAVDLVEKKDNFDAKGATLGLAPNGMKALKELSPEAVEYLLDVGIPMSTGGLMLPWWEIRDCLLRLVRKNEKITLRTGLQVSKIDDDDDDDEEQQDSCARVYFANSNDVLEGKLVVGADGVHSTVRRLLGLHPADKTGSLVWRGSIDANKDESELTPLLDKGIVPLPMKPYGKSFILAFNFNSKVPGKIAWVVSTKEENIEPGTHPWTLFENTVEDAEERHVIQSFFNESDQQVFKKYNEICIQKLPEPGNGWGGKGRITLLGDAAHAIRPTDGQGGSLAFESGVVLCRMLAQDKNALYCRSSCEKLIGQFENERLARVKIISDDQTMRAEQRYKGDEPGPWTSEYKEWVFNGI